MVDFNRKSMNVNAIRLYHQSNEIGEPEFGYYQGIWLGGREEEDIMSWKCPLCNSLNDDSIIRCLCGYEEMSPKVENITVPTKNIEELKVSYNVLINKKLRRAGIGSIVFGFIAVIFGLLTVRENVINSVLVLIGIFLFIEGIWIVGKPTPAGLIVDGIALIIVGLWNLIVSGTSAGGPTFGGLGVLQIIWGIKNFVNYNKFSGIPLEKPFAEALRDTLPDKCYRHYTTNAITTCAVCGNFLCDECTRRDRDVVYCPRCAPEGN